MLNACCWRRKAYVEGGFALGLYLASLVDQQKNADTDTARAEAELLLDLLTPVIKAWGSDYSLKANDYAIQILGGYGYTRDFPVEQYYRDNRLNPIHEGTNGIQAIDLLGRKILQQDGAALALLQREIRAAIAASKGIVDDTLRHELRHAADRLESVVIRLQRGREALGVTAYLANAAVFMDMLGRIVWAWIWLKQATPARQSLTNERSLSSGDQDFYRGKLKACQYFYQWELPQTATQAELLTSQDSTCMDMAGGWF